MKKEKLSQLNILTIIAILACIVCVVVFAFVLAPSVQNRIDSEDLRTMNERWVIKNYGEDGDVLVTLPASLDVEAGDTVTLMSEVPDDVNDSSVIMFYTEFQNVIVMLGDERIYSNGVLNNQRLMKNTVPCYNVVSLENAEAGDVITIYMSSEYKHYSGEVGSIYYGTAGGVITALMKKDGASLVFGIALIIVVLILLAALVIMRDVEVDKRKAFYGFGFVLAAAVMSLMNNSVVGVITGNSYAMYMCGAVITLLLPILFLMYQSFFDVSGRIARIYEIGIYAYSVNMLVGIVFQALSVLDFAIYMIFARVLIVVGAVSLSVLMYLFGAYSDKHMRGNFIAGVVISVSALTEAGLSLFKFYEPFDGVVMQAGLYIFMALITVYTQKNVIFEMNRQKDIAVNSIKTEKERAAGDINTALIYGSLNQVMTELKDKDREKSRLIYDTSVYMKYNIDTLTVDGMVPFSTELEYIKAYLGIQRRRNKELSVVVEDKVIDFSVPFNTVEPLVENAVVNGALKSASGGRIVVRSYERLDCYAIQIVDNGKGAGPDKKFTGKQSFKDIRKKLKGMCGASVEIKNRPDKGTILTVKIPKDGYIIKE